MVLICGGGEGNLGSEDRRDGVKEIVENAGYTVIYKICNWDYSIAYETTKTELTNNPDIKAIFCANDNMALAALQAVKEKGLFGQVLIFGFD